VLFDLLDTEYVCKNRAMRFRDMGFSPCISQTNVSFSSVAQKAHAKNELGAHSASFASSGG